PCRGGVHDPLHGRGSIGAPPRDPGDGPGRDRQPLLLPRRAKDSLKSLRARWSLAFALAALLPLAVVMLLLANRIRSAVRADAGDRLNTTLALLQLRLRTDRDQIEHKLQLLGRDPTLKRLYLVRTGGGRDLTDYLATQRFLLGLDFLSV